MAHTAQMKHITQIVNKKVIMLRWIIPAEHVLLEHVLLEHVLFAEFSLNMTRVKLLGQEKSVLSCEFFRMNLEHDNC